MIKPDNINAIKLDSFALFTITNRFPHIIKEIKSNNILNKEQVVELDIFESEILKDNLKMLTIQNGDYQLWNDILFSHKNSWVEEPFLFVEFYFYRRILEILSYFKNRLDPYKPIKQNALLSKSREIITIANNLNSKCRPIKELLAYNLWSNRADLSQIQQSESDLLDSKEKNIIINDTSSVIKFFERKLNQVDILLDNSGLELSVDLILSYYLLEVNISNNIFLHSKSYPIFVSDAIPDDVLYTLEFFVNSGNDVLKNIGEKLTSYIKDKIIIIDSDPFWTLPESFLDFNSRLKNHFAHSDLVIIKGDLHYRRLVEDRYWDYTTNLSKVIEYFPANTLIIRALKSELVLGLTDGVIQKLFNEDPNWLINGKYGIIQLNEKQKSILFNVDSLYSENANNTL